MGIWDWGERDGLKDFGAEVRENVLGFGAGVGGKVYGYFG